MCFRANESNLGASAHRTQQLGGVSHCGSSVAERRGELGRLTEVVLRVLWWLVDNTCKHVAQRENKEKIKQKVFMVKQLQPWITQGGSKHKYDKNTSMSVWRWSHCLQGFARRQTERTRVETISDKCIESLSKLLLKSLSSTFQFMYKFWADYFDRSMLPFWSWF